MKVCREVFYSDPIHCLPGTSRIRVTYELACSRARPFAVYGFLEEESTKLPAPQVAVWGRIGTAIHVERRSGVHALVCGPCLSCLPITVFLESSTTRTVHVVVKKKFDNYEAMQCEAEVSALPKQR